MTKNSHSGFFSRYSDILFLILVSLIFFFLMTFDINSWYYSAIGDEYSSYEYAVDILNHNMKISLLPQTGYKSIFSQDGVYNMAPVLFSVYQAGVMGIFGQSHSGWVYSSIIATITTIWFYYFLVKELNNRRTAVFATVILASCHYIWAFTHLGYWNIHAILPTVSSMMFYFIGKRKKSFLLMFLAGISSGLGFYTYYTARLSFPLLLILAIFSFKFFRKNKRLFIFLILGFLVFFLPFAVINNSGIFQKMSNYSLLSSPEIPSDQRMIYFFRNIRDGAFSFFANDKIAHYTSGALFDPLSQLYLLLGTITILIRPKKYITVITWLLLGLIVSVGFSGYPQLSLTRILYIVPAAALISALGMDKLLILLSRVTKYGICLLSLSLIAVIYANLHQFYRLTPSKIDLTIEAVTIGAATTLPVCRHQAYIIFNYPLPLLSKAVNSYNLNEKFTYLTSKNAESFNPQQTTDNVCIIVPDFQSGEYDNILSSLTANNNLARLSFSSPKKNKTVKVFYKSL